MAKKMSKRLVALSSAAIVAVYGIGYGLTQPAAALMAAGQTTPLDTSLASTTTTTSDASPSSAAPTVQPTQLSIPQSSAASTSATLKDGSYSGSGMSRHGGVSVQVTIQKGRIVSAPITGVTTRYSRSVIAGLPASVVSAQSSQIDLVSGATDSSMAYVQAVSQALAQAHVGAAVSTSNTSSGVGAGTVVVGPPSGQGSAQQGGTVVGNVQGIGPNGGIYGNGGRRRDGFERD